MVPWLGNICLSLVFLLSPLLCTVGGAVDGATNRISLAISGGASKGAYEAGLTWGLVEVLKKMSQTREWTASGVPRPLEVSSIAGTSAGGINTLLTALVWSVNAEGEGGFTDTISDNIFRDVWLTPDVNRLLPAEPDSALYFPDDALLSRKDLISVARELRKKWQMPGTFRSGIRLPLGVTTTRVRPDTMQISGISVMNQRFFIPFEMRTGEDGSAAFMFDPDDYPSLVDPSMILMPRTADRPPFTITDQQVEDALMATSAFPGGFGRKHLKYCRNTTLSTANDAEKTAVVEEGDAGADDLVCPDGYELAEAEFADGGLFDNLPLGLSRSLSESSRRHKVTRLPVRYIYIDPNRQRYETGAPDSDRACDGDNPPNACRERTFDIASEFVVLGGAIGTARKYELYRELTGENWRLNLSQISRSIADLMDDSRPGMACESQFPFFDGQPACSDRMRYVGRLLDFAHSHRLAPILPPLSVGALKKARIATSCRQSSVSDNGNSTWACKIDATRLRKQLADGLIRIVDEIAPDDENLKRDIRKSALSVDFDRLIHVTSRGGPITGSLLGDFGAFIDYKFREYDYYAGIYDAIVIAANDQCSRLYPAGNQKAQIDVCRDQFSEQFYRLIGVADDAKSKFLFALMAQREFGKTDGLRFAYDPMPPEDRDIRIIFDGLEKSFLAAGRTDANSGELISIEREFFDHLKSEGFQPSANPGGGKPLLALIMDDPEYWAHELVNRATSRLVYLEKQAESVYRAREPDPQKQEKANPVLMGAGALVLRTATYQYPPFTLSPSIAPESWIWRTIIPYEAGFDFIDGDVLVFWQPTWNFNRINAGLRLGLGFTGGTVNSDEKRENYGVLGLDLTRLAEKRILSGWGVTPAAYHSWKTPGSGDQTTFGMDVHVNLLANRLRISLGARDIINDADDTLFLTIGIRDLPGLAYWLTR